LRTARDPLNVSTSCALPNPPSQRTTAPVTAGTHVHLDAWNVLESGSVEIIFERAPDSEPGSDAPAGD
jgi:hypothetical protein